MKTCSVTTGTVTTGSATLAQINYDDSLSSASFYSIAFRPADAATSSIDWDAVRSFVLVSGSTQIPTVPEFTTRAYSAAAGNVITMIIPSASYASLAVEGKAYTV